MYNISVILPIYQVEKYVGKCITSILNQSLRDFELIIIDNASRDRSMEIVEKCIEKSDFPKDNIKILRLKENAGPGGARNRGLDVAEGKYICFIDSDDYIDKDYIETLYTSIESLSSDMVFAGYRNVTSDGKVISEIHFGNISRSLEYFRFGVPWGRIIKREIIEKGNIRFPEKRLGEDVSFLFLICANCKSIQGIPYVGYNYICNPASISRYHTSERLQEIAVEELADELSQVKNSQSPEAYYKMEYYLIRSYAFFLFILGRHGTKKSIYDLATRMTTNLDRVALECYKNPLLSINALPEFPFVQRMSVLVFANAYRMRCLKQFAYLFTRF